MPELPDVEVYVEALRERVSGAILQRIAIRGPFLLRTVSPPLESVFGQKVREVRRVGKRVAFGLANDVWVSLHLMIAGRLHWRPAGAKAVAGKNALAVLEFDTGSLALTEAGTQHRAALHVVVGEEGLRTLHAGGIEPLEADLARFTAALRGENHTLKRALTDPRLFSGIGNAYSDEILHRARLSPVALSQKLTETEASRLFHATRDTLTEWMCRLKREAGAGFPEKVTAFREGMAVHGRYGEPCPRCGAKVQRIRYAANETDYCAPCQTGGKLLADRGLSRLLREDWPRSLDEMEALKRR
jgi:formamidopyrimidine-DNA glycosylase